jgi:hypothetical protein
MPIQKKTDGWYWGDKGPFPTKLKALKVGQAAYASGFHEEKREKNMVIAIDYHDTYATDPKMWNVIIEILWLRKNEVICISRDHNGGEDEIYDSIGKFIGKKNVYITDGMGKKEYCKKNNIDVDIWIDDNPKHITEPE